jgi:hypothetical protein
MKTTPADFITHPDEAPLKKQQRKKSGREKGPNKSSSMRRKGHTSKDDFTRRRSQLEKLFEQYNPHDVCIALNVSDLWLPNISSQVKHLLAFSIFASMSPLRFAFDKRIDSYEAFREFVSEMYGTLPDFSMLEDYVPETDWGEVKVFSQGQYLRLFYGSSIERMSDYVDAFKLQHCSSPLALNDLHTALKFQNYLISAVDRAFIGDAADTTPGHIETPDKAFWDHCHATLVEIPLEIAPDVGATPDLMIELGAVHKPTTQAHFGDALMTGTLLPAISIRIEGKQYPLSLRNALGSVVDYWDARHKTNDSQSRTESVAVFLGQRFHPRTMLPGPLALATRAHTLPYRFAAFIHNERKCQFVIVLEDSAIAKLPDIERDIRNIFAKGEDWGLRLEGDQRVAELRDANGNLLNPDEITIIAVIPRTGTAPKRVRLPKTTARVLSLPDFVTIFDSLEDFAELDLFWSYLDGVQNTLGPGLIGITDMFATFRDSHGVLIAGAISPNLIFVDPHWGSNWRYRELKDFWKNAPPLFPNDAYGGWIAEPLTDGIQRLTSKSSYSLSWSTTIGDCILHFLFNLDGPDIDELSGRTLELMVQCLADSLFQRKNAVENLPIFSRRRIVTVCSANEETPAEDSNNDNVAGALFNQWHMTASSNSSYTVNVSVNLARAQSKFLDPVDNHFEAECAKEWINGIEALLGEEVTADLMVQSDGTGPRLPRFTMTRIRRPFDAPDFANPDIPKPNQYKIARRDLALVFKGLNTSPDRYELAEAKAVIDPARDAFRTHIHDRIAQLNRRSLLILCIQQLDALTVEYLRAVSGFRQSMSHQVSYDRPDALSQAYDRFVSNARNYRYLLESCLSQQSTQLEPVTDRIATELIASIDWLFVLYNASDVLHNDIDVAGVELDSSFVPRVFYSSNRDDEESKFGREMASAMLGFDLEVEDEVISPGKDDAIWQDLDRAFLEENGFSFTHLTANTSIAFPLADSAPTNGFSILL